MVIDWVVVTNIVTAILLVISEYLGFSNCDSNAIIQALFVAVRRGGCGPADTDEITVVEVQKADDSEVLRRAVIE